jgi:hypothetical protein
VKNSPRKLFNSNLSASYIRRQDSEKKSFIICKKIKLIAKGVSNFSLGVKTFLDYENTIILELFQFI